MTEDIRWKQRFDNYLRAYETLRPGVELSRQRDLSELEQQGLIQGFEFTHELAWKVLKDYLEGEGFSVASPRDAIKQAFQSGLLADDHVWIEALKDRNLTVHTYEEKIAAAVEQKIRKAYFPALMAMSRTLPAKAD